MEMNMSKNRDIPPMHPASAMDFLPPAQLREVQFTRLKAAGTPIGANDLWIACHALATGATLVTHNIREFERVDGLRLENWAE